MFKYIDERKEVTNDKTARACSMCDGFFCQGIHSCDGVCDGITEEVSWGDAAAS